MSEPAVLVIGGGPAGLAMAAELGRHSVPAVVLEQGDGAGMSWRSRYDRLRLNTCRMTSSLPKSRYPKATGVFPTRDQMVSYLDRYATTHRLNLRFNTPVGESTLVMTRIRVWIGSRRSPVDCS